MSYNRSTTKVDAARKDLDEGASRAGGAVPLGISSDTIASS
jgi:hypothetical protein